MRGADEQADLESPHLLYTILIVENKHCSRFAPTRRNCLAMINFWHRTGSISQLKLSNLKSKFMYSSKAQPKLRQKEVRDYHCHIITNK